jgi:hypothetical protein
MKPRLLVAFMTMEDYVLWDAGLQRDAAWAKQFLQTREWDRNDADLMLAAQRDRFLGNICSTRGSLFDWEFDVVMRLGTWRMYWPGHNL